MRTKSDKAFLKSESQELAEKTAFLVRDIQQRIYALPPEIRKKIIWRAAKAPDAVITSYGAFITPEMEHYWQVNFYFSGSYLKPTVVFELQKDRSDSEYCETFSLLKAKEINEALDYEPNSPWGFTLKEEAKKEIERLVDCLEKKIYRILSEEYSAVIKEAVQGLTKENKQLRENIGGAVDVLNKAIKVYRAISNDIRKTKAFMGKSRTLKQIRHMVEITTDKLEILDEKLARLVYK